MPKARKQQEIKWLQMAQHKCAAFPQSLPKDNDEKPDFLFPEVELGIEVTEYVQGQTKQGSPMRRQEEIQEDLVKKAQKRFEATHKERLHVSVFWCAATAPKKDEFEHLIQSIARVVTALLAQGRECWRPDLAKVEEIKLGRHLGQIGIYRLTRNESYWGCDEAGAIGNDVNRVQILIRQKDAKVSEYRNKCRSIWLLIAADNKHLSSVFSPDEDFPNATFRTTFDRVFILDAFANEVIELKLSI